MDRNVPRPPTLSRVSWPASSYRRKNGGFALAMTSCVWPHGPRVQGRGRARRGWAGRLGRPGRQGGRGEGGGLRPRSRPQLWLRALEGSSRCVSSLNFAPSSSGHAMACTSRRGDSEQVLQDEARRRDSENRPGGCRGEAAALRRGRGPRGAGSAAGGPRPRKPIRPRASARPASPPSPPRPPGPPPAFGTVLSLPVRSNGVREAVSIATTLFPHATTALHPRA